MNNTGVKLHYVIIIIIRTYLFVIKSCNILQFIEPTQDNFAWASQATKLLLALYQEKKASFRDPKIKKKKI